MAYEYLTPSDIVRVAPGGAPASVSPGGTAWTWGAWTEIVAVTGADWALLSFTMPVKGGHPISGQGTEVQIGIGGAGAEAAIATYGDWQGIGSGAFHVFSMRRFEVPLNVAAGVRLSVRIRTSYAFTAHLFRLTYLTRPVAGNMQTTSLVPTVTPTATKLMLANGTPVAWSNGAWVQVVAITPDVWTLFNPSFASGAQCEVDLGVGAAGAEAVVQTFRLSNTSDDESVQPVAHPTTIPSGVRLALRCRTAYAGSTSVVARCNYYEGTL